MLKEFDLILYHGNCPDGFTAAWTFHTKFGDKAEYIPQKYHESVPDVTNKTVAIVDFSYSRETMIKMSKEAKYIVILDHHRSAQRDLEGLKLENGEIIFDMNLSGAQLAWDYLYTGERPWFIEYVADRDLWQHKLLNTKEISQALYFEDYFKDFNKLYELYCSLDQNKDIQNFADKGKIMIALKDKDVNNCASYAVPAKMIHRDKEYNVRLICCPRQYRSDVGNKICEMFECDFSVVYFYDFNKNQWWISMRASKNSPVDLSELSSTLPGGGGHTKAAGFVIDGRYGDLSTYFKKI